MAPSSQSANAIHKMAEGACLTAKDAAFNLADFINSSSMWAFRAVRECEKDLDNVEQQIDERLPEAITRVSESQARDLIACLRFSIDLERIGDLLMSVAMHLQDMGNRLGPKDREQLSAMAQIVHRMLEQVNRAFLEQDLAIATEVLRTDSELDKIRNELFQRHLRSTSRSSRGEHATNILLVVQALERAGDHAKNLAEEVFHLVEGHSHRHVKLRKRASRTQASAD